MSEKNSVKWRELSDLFINNDLEDQIPILLKLWFTFPLSGKDRDIQRIQANKNLFLDKYKTRSKSVETLSNREL